LEVRRNVSSAYTTPPAKGARAGPGSCSARRPGLSTTARTQLAAVGYEVLRFDYYGSGDSAGEGDECTIEQCLEDVGTAIDELKDMSGVQNVTLVGLRVGATLAAIAAASRSDIESLVLWDPVISGRRYLEDMQRVEEAWFRQRPGGLGNRDRAELFGFPLTQKLTQGLEGMDIRSVPRWSAKHVFVLVSDERPGELVWPEHLAKLPVKSTYRVVPGGGDWEAPGAINRSLLAHNMLQAIVELMR
jgi:pimeloyl-ACP methyl ester carboxylesterase